MLAALKSIPYIGNSSMQTQYKGKSRNTFNIHTLSRIRVTQTSTNTYTHKKALLYYTCIFSYRTPSFLSSIGFQSHLPGIWYSDYFLVIARGVTPFTYLSGSRGCGGVEISRPGRYDLFAESCHRSAFRRFL